MQDPDEQNFVILHEQKIGPSNYGTQILYSGMKLNISFIPNAHKLKPTLQFRNRKNSKSHPTPHCLRNDSCIISPT